MAKVVAPWVWFQPSGNDCIVLTIPDSYRSVKNQWETYSTICRWFNNDIVRRKIRTVNAHFCVVIFHGRYATILYFLDNVEDGGETAFPIADNSTFDDEVGAVIKELYIEYHVLPSALSSELIRHLVK